MKIIKKNFKIHLNPLDDVLVKFFNLFYENKHIFYSHIKNSCVNEVLWKTKPYVSDWKKNFYMTHNCGQFNKPHLASIFDIEKNHYLTCDTYTTDKFIKTNTGSHAIWNNHKIGSKVILGKEIDTYVCVSLVNKKNLVSLTHNSETILKSYIGDKIDKVSVIKHRIEDLKRINNFLKQNDKVLIQDIEGNKKIYKTLCWEEIKNIYPDFNYKFYEVDLPNFIKDFEQGIEEMLSILQHSDFYEESTDINQIAMEDFLIENLMNDYHTTIIMGFISI